ncbi:Rhamnolipids biosynthesis 3-oxoacyl-[acyl-carrier-protein] reductase [BD1-7 clade bacterium]|uniref:Rhamnolipids biosynthesis 3-oxoacyl-[acyl-carrier-protein] reductase n=1 Tax=BD1-7 clade bacterium TaxID=2029982 RepID=A0A5S9N627_9GAMM|nr:Rhamnolipids biosynthesis 3-oxoacyl-[acyl-carrier-protein] reductase [BD1-7 clade bacterium]CAA0084549.1 Rhamnolipids biosynthesis 3-oxoacyl-[acyl-carrier-protein] reductase [BD1-7 clade bacterium]
MLRAFRKTLLRPPFAPTVDLTGRHFIVTGASKGSLGFATAKCLLEWGATVTVTRRSQSQAVVDLLCESMPPEARERALAHDLDIGDITSTNAFADWYLQTGMPLDVLINNAGIHLDLMSRWTAPKLSADGFEIQWRTNYLGTVHLTHRLLPRLLASAKRDGNARVVNVVSMLHDKGINADFFEQTRPYNSWNAYGQSKLGLVHHTHQLQALYGDLGLQAYCLHPGAVYTNVAGKGLSGNPAVERIRNAFAPIEAFFLKTPEEGAQTQILCATADGLSGGSYYRNCRVAKASTDAADVQTADRLWSDTLGWLDDVCAVG